ncbi:MAG TPA: outer membrane lipoprotein carrier protein LolA [Gammaproteobacteria bacterium]|nr:outer membrane lipoprotein carrier protein LolA [Gammaproteobacteria bacterium]
MRRFPHSWRCFAWGLLVWAAPCVAPAAENQALQEVITRLQSHALVAGEFVQQRRLKGFSRSLKSTGRFVFWREGGLYWRTETPFTSATTFTGQGPIHWQAPGVAADAAGPPNAMEKHSNKILLAFFGADLEALARLFELDWQVEGGRWTLDLRPRDALLGKVLRGASIHGGEFIEGLRVRSARGDVTEVAFSQLRVLPGLSAAACRRYFGAGRGLCAAWPPAGQDAAAP